MGNQVMGEQDNEQDSESSSSQQEVEHETSHRAIPVQSEGHSSRSHRSHKHIKQRVRLVPLSGSPNATSSSLPNNIALERDNVNQSNQVFHLRPGQSCTADELTEEEQVKIAQRMGYIQHLPLNKWNETNMSDKKVRECCICMIDFEQDEPIRYLPCMHYYHVDCIDDWLMRSFTCPSCMEPVDAALLLSFDNQDLDES